jgi:hypothetical protein
MNATQRWQQELTNGLHHHTTTTPSNITAGTIIELSLTNGTLHVLGSSG